jgi:integrase
MICSTGGPRGEAVAWSTGGRPHERRTQRVDDRHDAAPTLGLLGNQSATAGVRLRVDVHPRCDCQPDLAAVWLRPRPLGTPTSWGQLAGEIGQEGLVRHGLRHTALTWTADAGIELHILQRVAGHQDPAVTARYLHPDTQAMLDAGTAFSAWWSDTGPEKRHLGVVRDGGAVYETGLTGGGVVRPGVSG